MWSKLLLYTALIIASASSQTIDQNSNAEVIQAAITNDTEIISASSLADSASPHEAPVYMCVLVQNVVADPAKIMDDPQSGFLDLSDKQKLNKREWADNVLMIIQAIGPEFLPIVG